MMTSETEEWRDIPGFEGRYQASSLGRVRSLIRGEHVMTLKPHRDGYRRFNLRDGNGRRYTWHVHRAVGLAFLGPRPANSIIDHRDLDHTNDQANNLRYVSTTVSSRNVKPAGQGRSNVGVPHVYRHGSGGFGVRVDVSIRDQRFRHRVGRFSTIEAAAVAAERFLEWARLVAWFAACPCGSGKAIQKCCHQLPKECKSNMPRSCRRAKPRTATQVKRCARAAIK